MNRIEQIRAEEKKYHDSCYEQFRLFEAGSWLRSPVQTVLELVAEYEHYERLNVLDLGSGIGRNSIPIAQTLKHRAGKVVCVDLLESAIAKLKSYSEQYEVDEYIVPILSDIESFNIEQDSYHIIFAVSALEHVNSEALLIQKLQEMNTGTKSKGANCIIIGSNVREEVIESGQQLDPMFEVNLPTSRMLEILDQQYAEWIVQRRDVRELQYTIDRDGIPVKLTTDCITYVVKKI